MPVYGVVECCLCARMFRCNIARVHLETLQGERRPVCLACLLAGNQNRVRLGGPPIPIPRDAYEPEPS
jgi:hypothetical protein